MLTKTLSLLTTSLLLTTTTLAAPQLHPRTMGTAKILNRCPYPLYISSVDADHPYPPPPAQIPSQYGYTEPIRAPSIGGVSFKLSKSPTTVDPITQFEYTIGKDGLNYYDISLINCVNGNDANACPGWEGGLTAKGFLNGNRGGCEELRCKKGEYCANELGAYYVAEPVPQPVKGCGVEGDVLFVACAEE